jgi:hypothetical protein
MKGDLNGAGLMLQTQYFVDEGEINHNMYVLSTDIFCKMITP